MKDTVTIACVLGPVLRIVVSKQCPSRAAPIYGESVGRVTVQKLGEYLSARAEFVALEQKVMALKDKVVS